MLKSTYLKILREMRNYRNDVSRLTEEVEIHKKRVDELSTNPKKYDTFVEEIKRLESQVADLTLDKNNLKQLLNSKSDKYNDKKINLMKEILFIIDKLEPEKKLFNINDMIDENKIVDFFSNSHDKDLIYLSNYYFINYSKSPYFDDIFKTTNKMFNKVYMHKKEDKDFYNRYTRARNDYVSYLSYKIDFYSQNVFAELPTSELLLNQFKHYNAYIDKINEFNISHDRPLIEKFDMIVKGTYSLNVRNLIEFNETLVKLRLEILFYLDRHDKIKEVVDEAEKLNLVKNQSYIALKKYIDDPDRGRFKDYLNLHFFIESFKFEKKMFNIISPLGFESNMNSTYDEAGVDIYGNDNIMQVKNINVNDFISARAGSSAIFDSIKNKLKESKIENSCKVIWFNSMKISMNDFKKMYIDCSENSLKTAFTVPH